MATGLDVAAAVIENGPVDPLKLQKLVYFAQAWSLAWTGEPLFKDTIHAWIWGPTVPQVWKEYQQYGDTPIPAPTAGDASQLTASERELLATVERRYRKFESPTLSELSHDAPWERARNGLPPHAKSNAQVRTAWIRDHYRTSATFGHPSESSRLEPVAIEAAMEGNEDALADLLEQATGIRPSSIG